MSSMENLDNPRADMAPTTHTLIASDRVEGTRVFRSDGTKIGAIQRVMINKMSGHVAYAVMKFGGFLGMGSDHYPIPWSALAYNEHLGGYEVNLTDEQLKATPPIPEGTEWDYGDRSPDMGSSTPPYQM